MTEEFSGKVYERIALALVVARQKQLGIPVVINIWPKLPREIKLNTIRDAIAVLEVMHRVRDEMGYDGITEIDMDRWLAEANSYMQEIGVGSDE